MCVCVYIYICIYVYICCNTHIYTDLHSSKTNSRQNLTQACLRDIDPIPSTYLFIKYVDIYTCTYIQIYICVCGYMYVYVCIYAHIIRIYTDLHSTKSSSNQRLYHNEMVPSIYLSIRYINIYG